MAAGRNSVQNNGQTCRSRVRASPPPSLFPRPRIHHLVADAHPRIHFYEFVFHIALISIPVQFSAPLFSTCPSARARPSEKSPSAASAATTNFFGAAAAPAAGANIFGAAAAAPSFSFGAGLGAPAAPTLAPAATTFGFGAGAAAPAAGAGAAPAAPAFQFNAAPAATATAGAATLAGAPANSIFGAPAPNAAGVGGGGTATKAADAGGNGDLEYNLQRLVDEMVRDDKNKAATKSTYKLHVRYVGTGRPAALRLSDSLNECSHLVSRVGDPLSIRL